MPGFVIFSDFDDEANVISTTSSPEVDDTKTLADKEKKELCVDAAPCQARRRQTKQQQNRNTPSTLRRRNPGGGVYPFLAAPLVRLPVDVSELVLDPFLLAHLAGVLLTHVLYVRQFLPRPWEELRRYAAVDRAEIKRKERRVHSHVAKAVEGINGVLRALQVAFADPSSGPVKRVVFLFGSSCLSPRAICSLVMRSAGDATAPKNSERVIDRTTRGFIRSLVSSVVFQSARVPLKHTKLFVLVRLRAPQDGLASTLSTYFAAKSNFTLKSKCVIPMRVSLNAMDEDLVDPPGGPSESWFLCKTTIKSMPLPF